LFMGKRTSDNISAPANMVFVQKDMQQVSDTEMAAYVDAHDIAPVDDVSANAQIRDEDVPLVLADITDQELQQYLDQENLSPKLN
nr:hypothetical protein [Chitinophagaceae bacterium]